MISVISVTTLLTMENMEDITGALGEKNVRIMIQEVRNGKMKKEHLKLIAMEMGGPVHGVFVNKCNEQIDLEFIIRFEPTKKIHCKSDACTKSTLIFYETIFPS